MKVIHEGIGIRHGVITTIHDVTTRKRRGRAAQGPAPSAFGAHSLIPTTTGSATAIGLIYPELLGQAQWHRRSRAVAQCFV